MDDLPWKSWTYPWGAIWGLTWCIILLIVEFYLAVWPLGDKTSAKNFFANYVSVPAILVLYIGAKIYFGGRRWIDVRTIELDQGRRFYKMEDAEKSQGNVVKRVVTGIWS